MVGEHFIRNVLARDIDFIATNSMELNRNQVAEEALVVNVYMDTTNVSLVNFATTSLVHTENTNGEVFSFWVRNDAEGKDKAQKELKKVLPRGGNEDDRRQHLREYFKWVKERKLIRLHSRTRGTQTEVSLVTSKGITVIILLTVGTTDTTVNAYITLPQYNVSHTFNDVGRHIVYYELSKYID